MLKKHPELISTKIITIKDTIFHNDTLVIKQRIDSFVINTDTIIKTEKFIVERKKDIFKIVTKQDTIFLKDTIYISKNISVPVIEKTNKIWYFYAIFISICLMIFLYGIFKMFKFL